MSAREYIECELELAADVAFVDHLEELAKLLVRQIATASHCFADVLRGDHGRGVHWGELSLNCIVV